MVDLRRYKSRKSCPNWLKLWLKTLATDELATQWNQPGFMHSANALVWHCTLCLPRHSSTPCQIVRDNLLWMPPYGRLNFRYRRNYDCQSDKVIKNYHLEIPINGQNMTVQHVSKCDWFTGTIQKMIISNKMNIKKKIMDLQACHDNLTCSPMNGLNNPSYKWNWDCVHHLAAVKIYQETIT